MRDVSIERRRAGMAAAIIGAAITVFAPVRAATQNIVVDWNAIAITGAGASGQNSLQQERSIAITSVAVSDAVREKRILTASRDVQGYVNWPYAEQGFQLEREFKQLNTGQITQEVVYGITTPA